MVFPVLVDNLLNKYDIFRIILVIEYFTAPFGFILFDCIYKDGRLMNASAFKMSILIVFFNVF